MLTQYVYYTHVRVYWFQHTVEIAQESHGNVVCAFATHADTIAPRPPAFSYWQMNAVCWRLTVICWQLTSFCWQLTAVGWQLTAVCWQLTSVSTCSHVRRLLTVYSSLLTVDKAVCTCISFVDGRQQFVNSWQAVITCISFVDSWQAVNTCISGFFSSL